MRLVSRDIFAANRILTFSNSLNHEVQRRPLKYLSGCTRSILTCSLCSRHTLHEKLCFSFPVPLLELHLKTSVESIGQTSLHQGQILPNWEIFLGKLLILLFLQKGLPYSE
eukprot:TRINITY_DN2529_c0_g1_i2.p1 TRINITY_DN2529_c0_g1~~TRINITY_DN2529_c0_g1_i2.p1  ORF type:complete len:111 (+),score=8.52 TRINITY_DN2529_c0_g1_i2:119-451(+)